MCSRTAAILNIQIPQNLGAIVNVVSEFISSNREEARRTVDDFIAAIREPGIKMLKLYAAQAVMTFTYIYSLACVGKVAAKFLR